VGGDIGTLLFMAQLAAISQDPMFGRIQHLEFADACALDLDPMPDAKFPRVLDVAEWILEALDRLGIEATIKTSGATGLHIFVPFSEPTTFESGRIFAQIIATQIAAAHPKQATVERTVDRRAPDVVYIDYLQNVRGKTLAAAFSARASLFAGVSAPLDRKELTPDLRPQDFTLKTSPSAILARTRHWDTGTRRGISLSRLLEKLR
jgi:bifunctional non-homologous end joining protein LigD